MRVSSGIPVLSAPTERPSPAAETRKARRLHCPGGEGLAEAIDRLLPQPEALVFDYDGTVAEIPVDWRAARPRFAEYLRLQGLDAGCPSGLRLDETEAWTLQHHPQARARIFAFREALEASTSAAHRPIEGTLSFLRALPEDGPRLFVVSNNLRATVMRGLDDLGLTERFERILGLDDTGCPKPDTRAAQLLRQANGLDWSRAVFVGDSERTDGRFCERLGVAFINVSPSA